MDTYKIVDTNDPHTDKAEEDHRENPSPASLAKAQGKERELILEELINQIEDFTAEDKPVQLSGGLLNYVWRIQGSDDSSPKSLVAKWAPPYIASSPEVQLDPDRIFIEAKALEAFSPHGLLSSAAVDHIRLPRLIELDRSRHLLIMEDVCQCPDLGNWIQQPHSRLEAIRIGERLGKFIGKLHRFSAQQPELAQDFDNRNIQQTRLDVLYKNVFRYAQKAQLSNAPELGRIAVAYGELLQRPGKALIMGDLWLPSILVEKDELRIIDWELAHYGRPSQDVGHLAAHLWMHSHRPPSAFAAENAEAILCGFLEAYRTTLDSDFDKVFGIEGLKESSIHFGSEILARTVGIFQDGYLYEGMSPDHPVIQEAVQTAARHILSPLNETTFNILNWRIDL